MRTLSFNIFIGSVFLLALVGCKPTEKGYKSAYDVAVAKKTASTEEIGNDMIAVSNIESVDGPQLRTIDGYNVYYISENLKLADSEQWVENNYNVAVAGFKMAANSNSLANDLRAEGYDAFSAKTADDYYYTIVASFKDLSDAVSFYKDFSEKYKRNYVGLPGAPVIIFSKSK